MHIYIYADLRQSQMHLENVCVCVCICICKPTAIMMHFEHTYADVRQMDYASVYIS